MSNNQNSNANSNVSAYTKECLVNSSIACRALVVLLSNIEYWMSMEVTTVDAWSERAAHNRETSVVVAAIAFLDYAYWLFKASGDENMRITGDEAKACAVMAMYNHILGFWSSAPTWSGVGGLRRCLEGIKEERRMLMRSCNTLLDNLSNGSVQTLDGVDLEAVHSAADTCRGAFAKYLETLPVLDVIVTDQDIPDTSIKADILKLQWTPLPEEGDYVHLWLQRMGKPHIILNTEEDGGSTESGNNIGIGVGGAKSSRKRRAATLETEEDGDSTEPEPEPA